MVEFVVVCFGVVVVGVDLFDLVIVGVVMVLCDGCGLWVGGVIWIGVGLVDEVV